MPVPMPSARPPLRRAILVLIPALALVLGGAFPPARAACYDPSCGIGAAPLALIEDPAGPYLPGCAYEYTAHPSGTLSIISAGWLGPVQLPPCAEGPCGSISGTTGANVLRCLIANDYWCPLRPDTALNVMTGATTGPLTQALQTRWNADTDQRTGICAEMYTGNAQRMVRILIASPPSGGGSTGPLPVMRYETVFMKYYPAGYEVGLEVVPDALPARPATWGSLKLRYR